MITIFNGGRRSLSEGADVTYVQVHHAMVKHLHLFTPAGWALFTALSLHMDNNGYCFPSMPQLEGVTGMSLPTIRRAFEVLLELRVDGKRILAKRERFTASGRQTSNGYWLFPDCEGGSHILEGDPTKYERGEGIKSCTPINNNHIELESNEQVITPRKRKGPQLPKADDPGRLLFEAYRDAVFPELVASEFMIGEWMSARHIVYQMNHKGITPEQVSQAARTLLMKWGNKRELVTLNSLWKHWSSATTGAPVIPAKGTRTVADVSASAIDVFRKIRGES
jgi:hypothetical protein